MYSSMRSESILPLVSQTIFICDAKKGWRWSSLPGVAEPPSRAAMIDGASAGVTFS